MPARPMPGRTRKYAQVGPAGGPGGKASSSPRTTGGSVPTIRLSSTPSRKFNPRRRSIGFCAIRWGSSGNTRFTGASQTSTLSRSRSTIARLANSSTPHRRRAARRFASKRRRDRESLWTERRRVSPTRGRSPGPFHPAFFWGHTMAMAHERALRGLTEALGEQRGVTWTELSFGEPSDAPHPWTTLAPVPIGQTGVSFRGRIDRLDEDAGRGAAIITDYKVGTAPERKKPIAFDRGAELQRVFYALAVRSLLPELRSVSSQLTYLKHDPARTLSLTNEELEKAIEQAVAFTDAGARLQRSGEIAPGSAPVFFDSALRCPAGGPGLLSPCEASFVCSGERCARQALEQPVSVPDFDARRRALTDFKSNMLVEAAAGTGKTSLMAARVAMMIATGIDPAKIAAITFTEPAASELEARIRWTIDELRNGRLPPALSGVLSLPLGEADARAARCGQRHASGKSRQRRSTAFAKPSFVRTGSTRRLTLVRAWSTRPLPMPSLMKCLRLGSRRCWRAVTSRTVRLLFLRRTIHWAS